MSTDLIIVAAGKGERLGLDMPKAFAPLLGKRILDWTLGALLPVQHWDSVIIVVPPGTPAIDGVVTIEGGATRSESVRLGLQAGTAENVLIHDAARPFVDINAIQSLSAVLSEGAPSASLASQVRDTLSRGNGESVSRDDLWALQTPQGFARIALQKAFETAPHLDFTDETSLVRAVLGIPTVLVPAPGTNVKITYPEDLAAAEQALMARHTETRTGLGYDVHAFTTGNHVTLGGVKIPHDRGVRAHSDGDVIFHALADALYGTIADHDIGHHFPPGAAETKNMDSAHIVATARDAVTARGGLIVHADIMVLAEAPKLAPHRDAIRAKTAEALRLDIGRVSVKATTTEGLGYIGRKEGLAAQAVVTVRF